MADCLSSRNRPAGGARYVAGQSRPPQAPAAQSVRPSRRRQLRSISPSVGDSAATERWSRRHSVPGSLAASPPPPPRWRLRRRPAIRCRPRRSSPCPPLCLKTGERDRSRVLGMARPALSRRVLEITRVASTRPRGTRTGSRAVRKVRRRRPGCRAPHRQHSPPVSVWEQRAGQSANPVHQLPRDEDWAATPTSH
jgi:hypothetical protein